MTKLTQKVVAALSTGVMLLSMASPVFASTTLEITGNGASSDNGVVLTQTSTTTVVQSNSANINNTVNTSANTGDNDANRNTGGNVTVDTGDAKTNVTVANSANNNTANVDCCNAAGDTSVLISGNGADSKNGVALGQKSSVGLFQDNNAYIDNDVNAKSNTGKNDANRNTGGDVEVTTGNATTMVDVSNTANANWAQVGGNSNAGNGLVSLKILGNGADSDNAIVLALDNSTVLSQDNNARIDNDVDAKSNTGENDANRNTGGDVVIDTGNAKTDVMVDNAVNFNYANVDCGCLLDVFGKIAGNGYNSDNTIAAVLGTDLVVFQDNCGDNQPSSLLSLSRRYGCKLDNDVNAKAGTGKNDADQNTGSVEGSDPAVWTGNAESNTEVSNSGNSNVYGASQGIEWPDFDFNFNGWSFGALWAFLGH